jgi:hypothetical protein
MLLSILYPHNTNILLSNSDPTHFNNNINNVFKIWCDWFKLNLLSLNFTRTHFTKFTNKNNNQTEININIVVWPIPMMDRYSSVGIATFYRLDGPGIESDWGEILLHQYHAVSYTTGTGL